MQPRTRQPELRLAKGRAAEFVLTNQLEAQLALYTRLMDALLEHDDRTQERDEMIANQLVARGIRCHNVLSAMRRIPRHLFVTEATVNRAYDDAALPGTCGQTISQPYMVARMTELLELRSNDRVLEIGTGTGYQTAVLAALVPEGRVYTIEWHMKLMIAAEQRVRGLRLRNVTFRCGDGSLGWQQRAPFDAILITAGAPQMPEALPRQLGTNGRLVAPVGSLDEQSLVRIRNSPGGMTSETLMSCRFVKLVGTAGWNLD